MMASAMDETTDGDGKMEESFARVETKYMLTLDQAELLAEGLADHGFVRADFGSPFVQSLYYDTTDHLLIRDSLERPPYKEKLRLRAYGLPGTQRISFVEVKKKYKGVVYKRRAALPLEVAYCGLNRVELPEQAGQVGREALWMVRRYNLQPSAVIAYDRDAWFSEQNPDVRITFDRNICFRCSSLELTSHAPNQLFTSPEQRLLEIKTGGVYPVWLSRLLYNVQARRIHYSKYGFAYQHFIQPSDSMKRRCVS